MKKAIAMKCSKKDWDSIKGMIPDKEIYDVTDFEKNPYLTNNWEGRENNIANCTENHSRVLKCERHETFNAKIFLNACGIDCDVYEITKEQVFRLSKYTSLVNDWFPDAFKKELEVGNWYKSTIESLVFNSGNSKLSGFSQGKWIDYLIDLGTLKEKFNHWTEATTQEVEAALICETKKRGFVDKISFNALEDLENGSIFNETRVGSCFYLENNKLYTTGRGKWCVFKGGQWAQIIETITIQEAEKLLNKKIV